MIQDQSFLEYTKNFVHSYCDEMSKGLQQLCHPIVDKLLITGLDLLKNVTIEQKCEKFCGSNERQISQEFICDSIHQFYDSAEFLTSLLEEKVSSVCQTDKDPEDCVAGFRRWKPAVVGFLQRSTLRISREIDDKEFCGIGEYFGS